MSKINPFSHLSGLTIQKHPAPWWRSANSAQWGPFNVLLCKGNTWCTCEVTLTERCYKWKAFLATLLLSAFVAGSFRVQAQTFNTIYSFSPTHSLGVTNYGVFSTNSDGAGSWCTLFISGDVLYGTAAGGGTWGEGTIFKLNCDGSGFTNLHNFSIAVDVIPINYDGIKPRAGLTLSGDTLYGTAFQGGDGANGTVFGLTTNGDNFQTLYSFTPFRTASGTNSDGAGPLANLVVAGNVIYGSTLGGGPEGGGTLFTISTDGFGFATFDSLTNGRPSALVLSNNMLYGTTVYGGSSNNGTVFSMHVDGTGLTVLYSFSGGTDGAFPSAGLLLSGNVLYGTTTAGGAGQGTVFKLNIDGTGFATLHSFANGEGTPNNNYGALVLLGSNLFGLAAIFPQSGTLYSLTTNGTGFAVIHTFTGPGDPTGGQPFGGLTASGSALYGTTSLGGSAGSGTIFSLSLLPHLSISPSGQNVILTWPTKYAGFDYTGYTLQSATNLGPGATWTSNIPVPIVVNGQNIVTNPISLTKQFFRLVQ